MCVKLDVGEYTLTDAARSLQPFEMEIKLIRPAIALLLWP